MTTAYIVRDGEPYEVHAVDMLRGEDDGLASVLLIRQSGHTEIMRATVLAEDVMVHPHPMVAFGSALIWAAYKGEPNG